MNEPVEYRGSMTVPLPDDALDTDIDARDPLHVRTVAEGREIDRKLKSGELRWRA